MSINELPRLRRIDKETADKLAAEGMGAPTVFEGHDGSYWVLADQWRDYTHTSGEASE